MVRLRNGGVRGIAVSSKGKFSASQAALKWSGHTVSVKNLFGRAFAIFTSKSHLFRGPHTAQVGFLHAERKTWFSLVKGSVAIAKPLAKQVEENEGGSGSWSNWKFLIRNPVYIKDKRRGVWGGGSEIVLRKDGSLSALWGDREPFLFVRDVWRVLPHYSGRFNSLPASTC